MRRASQLFSVSIVVTLLAGGCATTAPSGPATLGDIRLVAAPGHEGGTFYGQSGIRHRRVIASSGACGLYEADLDPGQLAERPRTVLGQREPGEMGGAPVQTAAWSGAVVDDEGQVERAMVYAPEEAEADGRDPSQGVRVGLVFDGSGDAPWLLECAVPSSGTVAIPANLVTGAYATGRTPTACSHDRCAVTELELTPIRQGDDDVERSVLHAVRVEVLATADAQAVVAERRAQRRSKVELVLDEVPPELARDEDDRRRAWERTKARLQSELLASH